MAEGRSLAETPTWSVATVTTVMVFVCLLVERSICRLGKWLKRTKRKAMLASLEKIREEKDTDSAGNSSEWGSNRAELTGDEINLFYYHCPEHHEPFVSFEGLEQLHRFLFILGLTHVFYSFATVVLSMMKASVPIC
ncbi:MLO-like protein 4 [Platanthera guangdongensis]|uniref:MLO-like protein 4 n=1 Tax=Platanthera guangdongensis TaxID=2320717 RepID=A0ABR2MR98_9ASPA